MKPTTFISCWRLSMWDRLRCLVSGRVWLSVLGSNHAPVCLLAETPFAKAEK